MTVAQIRAEDVKFLVEELELSKDKVEYLLRSSGGSVTQALSNYINGRLF